MVERDESKEPGNCLTIGYKDRSDDWQDAIDFTGLRGHVK
jgi:hypothetical protein